jgi:hypothetical protein
VLGLEEVEAYTGVLRVISEENTTGESKD